LTRFACDTESGALPIDYAKRPDTPTLFGMTDPTAPRDPNTPSEPPDAAPPPPYGAAPGGQSEYPGQPGYSGQPGQPPAGPPGAAPFSPLVGRQLTSDETTWSMLGHLGGIVLWFVAPLIVMLTKGNESPYTKYHSVEALNFQITIAIAWVVSIILTIVSFGILFFLPFLPWVASIVFSVIAGLAANKGESYRYPLSIRLVK